MPDLTDDHLRQIAHGQERPTLAMTHRLAADLVTARDSLREARERLAAFEGRVWSDLAPPGGWVCAVCGVPVESEPCSEHEPPAVRLELAEAWIAHLEGAYGIPADARERWMRLRAAGALEAASPSPEPATAPESRSTGQLGGKADAPVLTVAELERLRRVMLASCGGIEPAADLEPRLAHFALEPDGGLIDVIDLATTLACRVEELEQRALDSMPAGVDQAGELEGCSGCAPAPLPPDIESAKARIAELEAERDQARRAAECLVEELREKFLAAIGVNVNDYDKPDYPTCPICDRVQVHGTVYAECECP
ncbi:hypothetical protein IU487_22175 [Nocardia puris]|uniref:hypothetical protein n=1 Tax=Nocardia puris TaxID=208602 RepID=UPI001892E70A|nr:hypothetical protein [Nocardia puris]MBF6213727.1 hypothetical protein [Nocardia puris]